MSDDKYLKIKFKKYNVAFNSEKADDSNKQIEVSSLQVNAFGYYDIIEIDNENDILGFKPGKDAEFNCDTQEFKTEYVLKLINIGIISGDKEAEFWDKNENKNKSLVYPFLVVVAIDLNDTIIKAQSDINNLFDNVKNILTEIKDKLKYNDYLSAFFCIGYTDIVVILQSNSLEKINNYITELRNYQIYQTNFVSSTYTIFGNVKGYNNIDKDKFLKENIDLTIRWAYREQYNEGNKDDGFFQKLNELSCLKEYGIEYGVFDRSCRINCSIEEFYNLFNNDNTEDPYRSNNSAIKIFNTKLSFDYRAKTKNSISKAKTDKSVNNALKKFLERYGTLIKNNLLHKRLFSAMKNMEYFYELIIISEHSEDIKRIVGKFYEESLNSFTAIINYFINNDITDKAVQIKYFEEALEKFRNCVQFLLFDILRSDHSYFEVPSIAHPSIGSTTKFLLAYNHIVNNWNKIFEDHSPKLTFLITSGGSDATIVSNLLWYFEDTLPTTNYLPIIITIPEASLYDVKGTIARLAHEFFHFKGNRLRKGMSLESGEKVPGRYSHFYIGMLYEYLDYCCYEISEGIYNVRDAFESENKEIKLEKFKDKINNLPVYLASDDVNDFCYDDNELKGNVNLNYAELVGKNLQIQLFIFIEELPNISALIDVCYMILKINDKLKDSPFIGLSMDVDKKIYKQIYDEFNNFCSSQSEEIDITQLVIKFLKYTLYNQYFKTWKDAKTSEIKNDIIKNVKIAFKNYEYGLLDVNSFFIKLYQIFFSMPNDAYTYATSQINVIPLGITQLSSVFYDIVYNEYEQSKTDRKTNLGIVYTSEYYGLDEYNSIPMTDYYSREWCKASLKFFLNQNNDIDWQKPLNYQCYKNLLVELYRECYADLCALCLLSNDADNSDEEQDSQNFKLFKEYVGAFLSEQLNIDKLFSIDSVVDPKMALRICSVYEAFIGNITEGNDRKKDLSKYLVDQYMKINKIDEETEEINNQVFNNIDCLFKIYKELKQKKTYVAELVTYLKICKQENKLENNFNFSNVDEYWLLNNWLDIYNSKDKGTI